MIIRRKVRKGDTIHSQGFKFIVDKILYQDCYRDKYNPISGSYIDLEFIDPQGGYHHWKSQFDGGRVIIVDPLKKYIESKTGWYYIPFKDMVGEVTLEVLERIEYSGALLAVSIGGEDYYVLIDIDSATFNVEDLNSFDNIYLRVKGWMNELGCKEFREIEINEYNNSELKQEAIDYVLKKTTTNNRKVALALKKSGDYLYFIKTDA